MLAKAKLNTIAVLISEAFIDSNISHDEFMSVSNVLKEYDNMEKETKSTNNTEWFFIVLNV